MLVVAAIVTKLGSAAADILQQHPSYNNRKQINKCVPPHPLSLNSKPPLCSPLSACSMCCWPLCIRRQLPGLSQGVLVPWG